jgi:4-amino-4-deoxy-L-arabinose transferase-like glycosyltransferase
MAVRRLGRKAVTIATPRVAAISANMSLLAIVLVSLLWRLPSLFDPPWVNDEGTYFAVAQAMSHGYRLYADVWENKPPGLYLLYSEVYHSFGASLIAIRAIAALLTAVIVVLTYRLALRPAGRVGAGVAALFVGLVLGVPFLEGTTLNAELPLAALSASAMFAALEEERTSVAGVCIVAALAFKAIAGFDAAALGLWLLLHRRGHLPAYVTGAAAALVLGLIAVWHAGILEPMVRDAVLYDLGYVGQSNGGSIPWLLIIKLPGLLLATIALRRAPFFYLWSVWAIVGALFSGRVFGHYALPAVVPVAISGTMLLRRYMGPRLLIVLPCAFLASALTAALAGWSLAATGHDSILARRLQYYTNFGRYALQTESYAHYRTGLDDHVTRNQRVASSLASLPAGELLVWGNVPWIYVLSGRSPATPYTSSLRQPEVPGETAALRQSLVRHMPAVVVLIEPPSPSLGAAQSALRRGYRLRRRVANATIYVRAARP